MHSNQYIETQAPAQGFYPQPNAPVTAYPVYPLATANSIQQDPVTMMEPLEGVLPMQSMIDEEVEAVYFSPSFIVRVLERL